MPLLVPPVEGGVEETLDALDGLSSPAAPTSTRMRTAPRRTPRRTARGRRATAPSSRCSREQYEGFLWPLFDNYVLLSVLTGSNIAVGGAGTVGGVGRGGGISNAGGPTLTIGGISTTVIDCLISDNQALGGDGSAGNGGNGLGGGIFTDKTAVFTVLAARSPAIQRPAGPAPGFSDGKGQGGGVFIATGIDVCIDLATLIIANRASTSNDDVFGVFSTAVDPYRAPQGSARACGDASLTGPALGTPSETCQGRMPVTRETSNHDIR